MKPEEIHKTVLLNEVVEWLAPRPGGRYMDGTLGLGGHSAGILSASGGKAEVMGLDRDEDALALAGERLAEYGNQVHLIHAPFSRFESGLDDLGWDRLDGAVLDLGVSSMQLDTPERGFSFKDDGPLDMRMDPSCGRPPAKALVNKGSYGELVRMIKMYGDEPLAGRIVKHIIRRREEREITGTLDLAKIVADAYPEKMRRTARNHPATRTFMALRIAVNSELEELNEFLRRIPEHLAPGARVCVISFHSLEDRAVKRAFRDEAKGCDCPSMQPMCTCGKKVRLKVLTKKPQLPGEAELEANVRSRSAKLRVAERVEDTEDKR